MMIRKQGLLLGIALFALPLLPACGGPGPTPTPTEPISAPTPPEPTATPTPAPPTFEEEWEALKAAAREEGTLVLVTGGNPSRNFIPPIREAFGEQFGLVVTIAGAGGSQHLARISAERQAGRYEVDIVIHGRTTLGERLGPAGFLTPIQEQLFHPDAIDLSKWWGGRLWWMEPDGVEPKYSVAVAARGEPNPVNPEYNTDLVTEDDIAAINSAWDFLDDKWTGKIIALSPLESVALNAITRVYSHPAMGPEWIARFFSQELDVTFVGDARQIVDSVALGGHALTFFNGSAGRSIAALEAEGLPLATWSKNLEEGGVLATASSWNWIGMMDRAPHPNAAKLFLNWWLTQEGQTAYNTLTTTPPPPSLRTDVPMGVTLPNEQRVPGAVYEMAALDTSLPDLREEATEFVQRLFLER